MFSADEVRSGPGGRKSLLHFRAIFSGPRPLDSSFDWDVMVLGLRKNTNGIFARIASDLDKFSQDNTFLSRRSLGITRGYLDQ